MTTVDLSSNKVNGGKTPRERVVEFKLHYDNSKEGTFVDGWLQCSVVESLVS